MARLIRAGLCALILFLPVAATAGSLSKAEVKQLALQAIREHPEVIMEAITILQQRQDAAKAQASSAALARNGEALRHDPNAPVFGNPNGDVTVVEFFDYNCPYCRHAASDVKALIENDGNLRLVYREWPILGPGSVFAAKAALAARAQGKYEVFHEAMMALRGRANQASVLKVARSVGLDIARLRKDMATPRVAAHIATSMKLAKALGINGTPSFVVGNTLVPGAVALARMKALVARIRSGG